MRKLRIALMLLCLATTVAHANGRLPGATGLAINPTDSKQLLLGLSFGLALTRDGGASWTWMCEQQIEGNGGDADPSIVVTGDGTLVVISLTNGGVLVSQNDGCSFERAMGPLEGNRGVDLTLDPSQPGRVLALMSTIAEVSDAGRPRFHNFVAHSLDHGRNWSVLAELPDDMWVETLELAPSAANRIYVSGTASANLLQGIVERSDDGGLTWTRTTVDLPRGSGSLFLSAIHPKDPDRLWFRVPGRGDIYGVLPAKLWLSTDGAVSFNQVAETEGGMLGFALSPDGDRIAFGGPLDGLFVSPSDASAAPTKIDDLHVNCLRWPPSGLYACGIEPLDPYSLGFAAEPTRGFVPVWHRADTCRGTCAPPSRLEMLCRAPWEKVAPLIDAGAGICQATSSISDGGIDAGSHVTIVDASPMKRGDAGSMSRSGAGCGIVQGRQSNGSWALWLVGLLCWILMGCEAGQADSRSKLDEAPRQLAREELMDPEQCKACHPKHYDEWASSMHAYAAEDPVFRAMNQRGQRNTQGELGAFCVKCHAPMALLEGATSDGLNLDDVPSKLKGVTCYVCHNAIDVGEHFNNDLKLASDTTMRASIDGPVQSPVHGVGYSAYLDSNRRESAELCGSCHDVVTPDGIHVERTFEEYEHSLFGQLGKGFETCAGCHMPGGKGRAAELPIAPERTVHEHLWPGVDVALSTFPGLDVQRHAIECELASNTRIRSVQHDGLGTFTVSSETFAGHRQPSGAAQDRRMWIEVVAYDADENVVFESGLSDDGEQLEKAPSDPDYDPQLVLYRDWTYDADGALTQDFWQAAPSTAHPDGYDALTLPYVIDPAVPHSASARYAIARYRDIKRMTLRLRIQPIGIDILDDLVRTGDLASSVVDQMPTFTLQGAAVEWRPDEPTLRSLMPDALTCPRR